MARQKTKATIRQGWQTFHAFVSKRWSWVASASIVLILVLLLAWLIQTGRLDAGLAEYTPPTPATQRAKTLWDWINLLLIPLVLAATAVLLSKEANRRQREAEQRRTHSQREIEIDRWRQSVLQACLDFLGELLLKEGLRASEPEAEVREVARAQVLTALRQLDGKRRGILLQFLYESGLIEKGDPFVDLATASLQEAYLPMAVLNRAELRGVNLRGANLQGAHLNEADLRGANLIEADLSVANLERANLHEADLRRANLRGADLRQVNLFVAILRGTNLEGANLAGADLRRAHFFDANLAGANLEAANLGWAKVAADQLAQAKSLHGAILPDGRQQE
ncbi:MAG: pentapeptide repeat-containing protein [Anaerolineae bacterium]